MPITVTIFVDDKYAAVIAGYEMVDYDKNNVSNIVPYINWSDILPKDRTFIFDDEQTYETYLTENSTFDSVRFILLKINSKEENNSDIYEINFSETYLNNCASSNFDKIIDSEMVLKST